MAATVKWPSKRLADSAEFRNGVNYNKNSFGEGLKVVGVSNFQDYTKPRYDELDQINPEGVVTERNILRDGDIVFVRSNGNREPFKIGDKLAGYQGVDLSKINFEAPAKKFEKKKLANSDLERLKAAVKAQLERMVRLNRTRADYLAKFEALIEAYNSGSRNIEEIFKDLIALAGVLTEAQERHVREHLREEELTIFDILTRPGPKLSTEEREEVKKVARQLLERLNALLVLGWRQKIQARAKIRLEIEDSLDKLPRAYGKELYESKCSTVFEHVYEAYAGEGKSVFNQAM